MTNEIWLTTSQAAKLEGLSRKTAYMKAKNKVWRVKTEKLQSGCGGGGIAFLIALSSLSVKAQKKYWLQQKVEVEEMKSAQNESSELNNEDITAQDDPEANSQSNSFNLAELKAHVGEERFNKLLAEAEENEKAVLEYIEYTGSNKKDFAEELAIKYHTSSRTILRWVKEYKQYGLIGLIRIPSTFKIGSKMISIDPQIEDTMRAEYLQLNQPTVAHVFEIIKKYCSINEITPPSRASVYRYFENLEYYEQDLCCLAREGEDAYNKKYAEKITRDDPEFVNQVWEGDHHRHDCFVTVTYKGKPVRLWMTVWLDVCSRVIAGFTLAVQANGRTIGIALRNGILKKSLTDYSTVFKNGVSNAMQKALDSLGWDVEMLEEISGKELPFYGLPKTLYIDNGEDYKAKVRKGLKSPDWKYSKDVRTTCQLLDIQPRFCTKYSPTSKGHIERWFGTFTDQFARYMPGYCGKDNKARPEGLDEKAMAANGELLTVEEIFILVEAYIYFYHNAFHRSLGMTPMEKYISTPKARNEMPDERALDICLMDVEKATVNSSGIQKFGTKGKPRYYKHPILSKYRGQELVVRYDPNRIKELHVFDPKTGNYICTAVTQNMSWDTSVDDLKAFKKRVAQRKKELKSNIESYRTKDLEEITQERIKQRTVAVGSMNGAEGEIKMVTGMEQAAKNKSKAESSQEVLKETSPAKTNVFDEYIRKAGRKVKEA